MTVHSEAGSRGHQDEAAMRFQRGGGMLLDDWMPESDVRAGYATRIAAALAGC